MVRKVKNCYGCPADGGAIGCLLRHERNIKYENIKGSKGSGHITVYSPKECCHKPKTVKEFVKRWKECCHKPKTVKEFVKRWKENF